MVLGKFITFEGGEGSGKSTQARLLSEQLWRVGIHTFITREPGGSPFAEALRHVILDPNMPPHSSLSEALLFYSARADHLDNTVRPALNSGLWVICDRFIEFNARLPGRGGRPAGRDHRRARTTWWWRRPSRT